MNDSVESTREEAEWAHAKMAELAAAFREIDTVGFDLGFAMFSTIMHEAIAGFDENPGRLGAFIVLCAAKLDLWERTTEGVHADAIEEQMLGYVQAFLPRDERR